MNQTIFRDAYRPYPYHIPHLWLRFDLGLAKTTVRSRFTVQTEQPGTPLCLDGEDIQLLGIWVDGQPLKPEQYDLDHHALRIPLTQASHQIEIESICEPAKNTTLMGLYLSGQ